jgi:DUF1680 family protein
MEEQLIIEVWDTFRDYIPEKNREIAASQFVDLLVGKDVEVATFESLMGYDPHLDMAIQTTLDEFNEVEEDDYGIDGDSEEDY